MIYVDDRKFYPPFNFLQGKSVDCDLSFEHSVILTHIFIMERKIFRISEFFYSVDICRKIRINYWRICLFYLIRQYLLYWTSCVMIKGLFDNFKSFSIMKNCEDYTPRKGTFISFQSTDRAKLENKSNSFNIIEKFRIF